MGIDNPNKRVGTNFIRESVNSDKGSPQKDPLANDGSGTSTHTKFTKGQTRTMNPNDGGRKIEGQNLRGYVRQDGRGTGGPTEDVTVAPDGTRRVKDLG
jgi:hypothetical protein